MPIALCPADLLALDGTDAAAFAHNQFTSDVKSLAPGTWQWSAWLDPQGRVRCFFALMRSGPQHFIAWLPLGGAAPMGDALARFVLRAAVKLDVLSDWTLHSLGAEARAAPMGGELLARDGGFAFALPGTAPRCAWIGPAAMASTDRAALARWRLDDIAAGLPLLAPELAGEFVAQALDLERMDAIRFDKGCYPGQEIAARLHFRGGNKRHLWRLTLSGAAPPIGTAISAGERAPSGRILYAESRPGGGSMALAVLADGHQSMPLATSGGQLIEARAQAG